MAISNETIEIRIITWTGLIPVIVAIGTLLSTMKADDLKPDSPAPAIFAASSDRIVTTTANP